MGGPPCPHPDGAFFKDGPNHFLEFVQNPRKIRKIRVVPLASGYPFFALNASIEPRSVHTCLLGLVGVPRAQRAAVAPYCAAWGRKPAILGPKTVVFSPSSGFWPFRYLNRGGVRIKAWRLLSPRVRTRVRATPMGSPALTPSG